MNDKPLPPILRHKDHAAPSVFAPDGLLREARRQKGLAQAHVPELCLLDPDGDIVRHLMTTGVAQPVTAWACYHSVMHGFELGGRRVGVVGCAVGAPYAVLVAEQMFASGCRLLLSITSSGELAPLGPRPYFILVERALRDEGTSYHYLPAEDYAPADPGLLARLGAAITDCGPVVHRGTTWTTDAPFRETVEVIERGNALGLAAIEMESAALYALAAARGLPIACLAHVTNAMATTHGDFEKGEAGGAIDALRIVESVALNLEAILSP
ncbi:MAG: nucleoside phosphorylase [Alphaproteobacteria bacterium]|nr:nucleoside phosphorylase [Alphaproteobacteria bacterium]